MNRRRFLVSTAGVTTAAIGLSWTATAGAATDDELAFANFGVSVEFLLKDFYARAIDAEVFAAQQANVLRRGRSAARQHAKALGDLLVGAGEAAPAEEDFAFQWPRSAFSDAPLIVNTGTAVLRPLLGSYQTAVASVSEPSYRILYASLAASLGQQLGALSGLSTAPRAEPFPAAVDLETASTSLESFLG